MGLIGGLVRFFLMRAVEITVILTILLFLPNIPPYCKFDTPYKVAPVKPLDGKLSLNEKLAGIEFWHQDSLQGAESFAAYNGELYTGLQTGEIVKLTGDKHISPIIQFGKPCKYFEEEKCGRPLGMVFDHTGALFVADAYYGIYKVDVKSGHKVQLVSPDVEINGKKPKLFNSVAVASSGEVYWTDSSTEFYLKDGVFDLLADGSGRVLKYDPKSKRNTVLIDGLHFANGIMLSQNEDFLVVAVTNRNEVLKYHLKGTKVGQYETLIGGLPGMPDNIRPDGHGGIILPLVGAHDADHPNVVQIFGPFPWMRKLIARGFGLLEFAFQMADRVYPNDYAKMGMHVVGHFSLPTQHPLHNRITVLHLSESGEILDSFHSTSGKAVGFSEAFIHNDYLLLGSPFNDFIGRISLKELGLRGLPTKPKVATTAPPKVTTTTTRPTTTTPPPTKAPTTKAPSTTTTTTPKPTTTKQPEKKQSPTTPKPAATTTTQKPVEKKEVPKAEAKQPTTTPKPATTTPKPATTTSKPATTTQKPVTTQKPTAKPKFAEQPKPAEKVAQEPIEEAKPPKQAERPKAGKSSEAPSQNKV